MNMIGSLRQSRRTLLALTAALALGAAWGVAAPAPAQAQWWSGIWVGPWPWLTYGAPATGWPQYPATGTAMTGAMSQSSDTGGMCPMPMISTMGSMGLAPMTDTMASCPMMGMMPMMGSTPMMGMMPMMPMSGMMASRMARPADTARRGELRTTVYVYDGFFLPSEITVPVGTTVTWVNRSTSPQSVASPGIWDSGAIPPGGRYAAVFAREGTFPYMGKEGMQGRITVAAPSAMGGQMGAAAPSAAPAPQAAQPAVGAMTATATLQPQRNSGVSGEATLTQSGNTTTVTVRLRAPSGGTAHAGHIHGGSCNGPILFALETIQLDASGQGSATSTVNAPLDPNTWWIQYHESVSPPGPGVTCGQVMASR